MLTTSVESIMTPCDSLSLLETPSKLSQALTISSKQSSELAISPVVDPFSRALAPFYTDPSLPSYLHASLGAFHNSGFDRGHLVPAVCVKCVHKLL